MDERKTMENKSELYIELQDTEWPFTGTDHDREIVRAIVVDEQGNYYFMRAERDDDFGKATIIETAGGGVECGEDLLEAIKRELQEETGAIDFTIKPICVYSVTGKTRVNISGEETYGMLYFAEIKCFDRELHSEIEKVELFHELPTEWTYPLIQPLLIEEYKRRK